MDQFLASVERKAFHMAQMATGNRDDALDIVQETMLSLAKNYADKGPEDWKPLFYRILHSKINDFHRRSSVRNRVKGWLGIKKQDAEGDEVDPFQEVADPKDSNPQELLKQASATQEVINAVEQLPARQQQAFLLRNWEGMSVAETAQALGCSGGSVKTHYSRAVHTLRELLKEHW